MIKSILLSIKPKYCELIASGKKTIEIRKTRPKLATPFKVYIYETKGYDTIFGKDKPKKLCVSGGRVIGEFVCDKIDRIAHCGTCNNDIRLRIVDEKICYKELDYAYLDNCKLSYTDIDRYSNGCDVYGWHISNLVIYDNPKELCEFVRICPEWEKGYITNKCLKCEHCYENSAECYRSCVFEGELPITRPPQSWCYVESEVEQ